MLLSKSGIRTVGPTGEVKGLIVTGFNVVVQVGGSVGEAEGGAERENGGGDNGECKGEDIGESWEDGGLKCSIEAGGSTSSSFDTSSKSKNSSSLPSIMGLS